MERMQHIFGKLMAGEQVILDQVEGYLGCHSKPNGTKSFFGYIEMPTEKIEAVDHNACYRLILADGRAGNIFTDVHPSNTAGLSVVEFHAIGGFKK